MSKSSRIRLREEVFDIRLTIAVENVWEQKSPESLRGFLSVENIGVEPMTSCMPCKRSSQLS